MSVLYALQAFSKAGVFHSNCCRLKAFLPQLGRNCTTRVSASLSCLWFLECCTLQSSHWYCLRYLSQSAVPFPSPPFLLSLLSCTQSPGKGKKEGGRSSSTIVASPDLACSCRHLQVNDVDAALNLLPLETDDVVFSVPPVCVLSFFFAHQHHLQQRTCCYQWPDR